MTEPAMPVAFRLLHGEQARRDETASMYANVKRSPHDATKAESQSLTRWQETTGRQWRSVEVLKSIYGWYVRASSGLDGNEILAATKERGGRLDGSFKDAYEWAAGWVSGGPRYRYAYCREYALSQDPEAQAFLKGASKPARRNRAVKPPAQGVPPVNVTAPRLPVSPRARTRKAEVLPEMEVTPTVRPLGTATRTAAAKVYNPTLSETDATLVALATELVTMKAEMTKLAEKVGKLESAVTTLIKRSMAQPKVAPVAPVVETPAATQQRMNPSNRRPVAQQQAPARPKAEPLPFLGNARLIKVFDTFIKTGKHFNRDHDANLAVPSSQWLLDAATEYLDSYEGVDQYLVNVGQYETRTVPQLRGVLGKMLTFYKSALARG